MYSKYHLLYLLVPFALLEIAKGQCLNYVYNSRLKGFRLNTTVLMIKVVSEKLSCAMECSMEACCRSINYKKTSTFQNEPNCEILHDVVYNTSESALKKNSSFDYVYLVNPEKEYNASCFPNDSEDRNIKVQKSCAEWLERGSTDDGVYAIDPDGKGSFAVRCEQRASQSWTVFQRRTNGTVNFTCDWDPYKNGFGNAESEFWLGLDKIYRLTHGNQSSLRIDLWDFNDEYAYAEYDVFSIANETDHYRLSVSNYSGTAGDALVYHNGQSCGTYDINSDGSNDRNCTQAFKSGWWFNYCLQGNLNSLYFESTNTTTHGQGICWYDWKQWSSRKKSEMKLSFR